MPSELIRSGMTHCFARCVGTSPPTSILVGWLKCIGVDIYFTSVLHLRDKKHASFGYIYENGSCKITVLTQKLYHNMYGMLFFLPQRLNKTLRKSFGSKFTTRWHHFQWSYPGTYFDVIQIQTKLWNLRWIGSQVDTRPVRRQQSLCPLHCWCPSDLIEIIYCALKWDRIDPKMLITGSDKVIERLIHFS